MIPLLVLFLFSVVSAQSPFICEDTISGQAPFNNNHIPCLLGCGTPLAQATGSLLPGSVNTTAIPYCRLDCVRTDATPEQSSAAPACNSRCENGNGATPDQLGWCMYWCVEGGDIEQLVVSTTCVPQLQFVPVTTSTIQTNFIVTIDGFSTPSAWASWYATQTVISRSSLIAVAPEPTSSQSTSDSPILPTMTSPTITQILAPSDTMTAMSRETSPGALPEQQSQSQTLRTNTTTTSAAVGSWCHRNYLDMAIGFLSLVGAYYLLALRWPGCHIETTA